MIVCGMETENDQVYGVSAVWRFGVSADWSLFYNHYSDIPDNS